MNTCNHYIYDDDIDNINKKKSYLLNQLIYQMILKIILIKVMVQIK